MADRLAAPLCSNNHDYKDLGYLHVLYGCASGVVCRAVAVVLYATRTRLHFICLLAKVVYLRMRTNGTGRGAEEAQRIFFFDAVPPLSPRPKHRPAQR